MAKSIRLRPWQKAALEQLQITERNDFLAVATPGAGKTTFALTAAARALSERKTQRIVVVAPTQHLKSQWAASANGLGLHLDPDWSAREGELASDMHGIVTTYQQVATSFVTLAKLSEGAFVILDEIHHAGDDKSWGESVVTAFGGAYFRLALSGTPFRSDTSAIPFVDYHLDEARADYEYGYGDALSDGRVVRPVYFPAFGGEMEWVDNSGTQFSASFDDAVDTQRANQRLRAALSADGEWIETVTTEAHKRLLTIRRTHPNAAGLVIATDQEHAARISALMKRKLGLIPVIATSEDPTASAKIARFSETTEPWIIAVRMISEGVDIPRLRLGVYATTTTTELFFRQAVGRFVRWTRGVPSQKSYLYIPDDYRLRRWASGIAEQRRHSLTKKDDPDEVIGFDARDEAAAQAEDADDQLSLFAVISAVATSTDELSGSIFEEELPSEWDEEEDEEQGGSEFDISLDVPPPPGWSAKEGEIGGGLTRKQLKSKLREQNAELARELVRFSALNHRAVNAELNRLGGITSISQATVEQLQVRLRRGQDWLRRI